MTLVLTILACSACGASDWYVIPMDCLGLDVLDCLDCGAVALCPIPGTSAVPVAHGSPVEADWYIHHPEAVLQSEGRL